LVVQTAPRRALLPDHIGRQLVGLRARHGAGREHGPVRRRVRSCRGSRRAPTGWLHSLSSGRCRWRNRMVDLKERVLQHLAASGPLVRVPFEAVRQHLKRFWAGVWNELRQGSGHELGQAKVHGGGQFHAFGPSAHGGGTQHAADLVDLVRFARARKQGAQG